MNGVIIVDKPKGLTSNKILGRVKKILNIKKAGYTGTLDPFATGVLPICLNEATKLIPYLNEEYKEYIGIINLGIETDTLDETGNILKNKTVGKIEESDILTCLYSFKGSISQIPPMYSALKVKGVRLYNMARKGEVVERKPREIFIDKIELLSFKSPYIEFYVRCSKGTYVRSLANDIGNKLGFGGCLKELKRVSSGQFRIDNSFNLSEIEENSFKLTSINELLKDYSNINVDDELEKIIRNGKKLIKKYFVNLEVPYLRAKEKVVINNGNQTIAILESLKSTVEINKINNNETIFKVLRVLNYS
ncbi:MAG: tRNA pseudouridine(55) synthase TruB [Thermodesulfobacteriota bacterium]